MTATPLKVQVVLFCYGGVHEYTHACMQRDVIAALNDPSEDYQISLGQAWGDALIDRCRAQAVEQFLRSEIQFDAMVMLDHDLQWEQGDVMRVAREACRTGGIVGAAVSKRARGMGIASAVVDMGIWQSGTDRLVEATYVGAAFTAYPRAILEAVFQTWPKPVQGFRPAFLPTLWPHADSRSTVSRTIPLRGVNVSELARILHGCDPQHLVQVFDQHLVVSAGPIATDYLSEDWAFCRRALELGYKCYLDLKPQVTHHGHYGYTIADAFAGIDHEQFKLPPKFSLLYATRGRAEQVEGVVNMWKTQASGFHELEMIISTDDDDPNSLPKDWKAPDWVRCVRGPSRGNVDAYNRAAYDSRGDVLVQVHDDVTPPANWDALLARKLAELGPDAYQKPHVLRVSDGLPASVNGKPGLLTVLIGTRAWFEGCGYFWCPSFASIGCDDHMTALAEKEDGVIVEAGDLVFAHRWEGPGRDETQRRSYDPRNWEIARLAMRDAVAAGLPKSPERWRGDE